MGIKVWEPKAADIEEILEYTFAGTWLATETIDLKVGAYRLITVTVGSDVLPADVAEICRRAWVGEELKNDETRTSKGNLYGEYMEITADTEGAKLILTGPAGVPITVSVKTIDSSEESADGTITADAAASTQTATGRHFADNAENYQGGALPVTSDTVQFRESDISCLYNVDGDAWASAVATLYVQHFATFTGRIGLWATSTAANGLTYEEYRVRAFNAGGGCELHKGAGTGSGFIFLQLDVKNSISVKVNGSGTRAYNNTPAVLISNFGDGTAGTAANVSILGGADVGLEVDKLYSPASTPQVWIQNSTVGIGMLCKPEELTCINSNVTIEDDVTFIILDGGTVMLRGNINNGTSSHLKRGVLDWRGNTIASHLNMYSPAVLNLVNNANESITATGTWVLNGAVTIRDPRGLIVDSGTSLNFVGNPSLAGINLGKTSWTANPT